LCGTFTEAITRIGSSPWAPATELSGCGPLDQLRLRDLGCGTQPNQLIGKRADVCALGGVHRAKGGPELRLGQGQVRRQYSTCDLHRFLAVEGQAAPGADLRDAHSARSLRGSLPAAAITRYVTQMAGEQLAALLHVGIDALSITAEVEREALYRLTHSPLGPVEVRAWFVGIIRGYALVREQSGLFQLTSSSRERCRRDKPLTCAKMITK
jgi:hypothetical protein